MSFETEFNWLADEWFQQTYHLSCGKQEHSAAQLILRLGDKCVPLIIARLRENRPELWFGLLFRLLGEGPVVPPEARGRVDLLRELWLDWYDKTQETNE